MKRILALSPIALIIVAIVAVLLSNKKTLEAKNVVKDRSQIAVAVKVEAVAELPITGEMKAPATLTPTEVGTISSTTPGRLSKMFFELGTEVRKGQVLGKLDLKETELKLKATEIDIDRLKKDYERNKILAEGNAINGKAVYDSKFDLDKKIIEAEQLRTQISNATLISPISGIITEKSKESGEYVNSGEVVAKIINTGSLKAKIYIAENKVFKLKEGQEAVIVTDVFPDRSFKGIISFISPTGDENHNYVVELKVENNNAYKLKAGMYALVQFNEKEISKVIQISKAALVEGVKNPFVFVLEEGKAVEKKIKLGRDLGDKIEVLSGLSADEQVIVSGQINIINGAKVRVVKSNKI